MLAGNLTRDCDVRSTASGMPVVTFGIAVNERVKNGDQWEDRPNFFDCVFFGTRAEKLAQYISKGSKVAVEGKLRWSQWEKDGQKRSKVEVIVDDIELMSGGQQSQQQQAPQYAPQPQQYAPQQYKAPQFVEATLYDNDIPF